MQMETLPDLTGYGLLGAFLLLVIIFLAFGVVILRHSLGVLKALSDEWARRNHAREESLTSSLRDTQEVIRENTKALASNATALNDVERALIRVGTNGH